MSANKYYTEAELIEDAAEQRAERRARTEWNPSDTLREANAARMRAEASESELRSRALNTEQVARATG